MADIRAESHAGKPDIGNRGIGGALRLPHRIRKGGDAQHAAAADHRSAVRERGTCMEHDHIRVRVRRDAFEAFDNVSLARMVRISGSREHDAKRRAPVPLGVDRIERGVHRVLDQVDQVGLEPRHDRLRFRVAQATIKFKGFRAAGGVDHHARIEEPGVGNAFRGHAVHGRHDDLAHDPRMQLGRDHRRGRISAHAASVRARVAILQSLVVLRRRQRQHILAVDHDDEARFLAGEKLFDDDAGTGIAHRIVDQHRIDRRVRLGKRHRDDDALPRGETVGLDHDGRATFIHIRMRRGRVHECAVFRRRDIVPRHERLRKILGAFKLRGSLRRAENLQSRRAKGIHDAGSERPFRTDDRQRDVLPPGARDEIGDGRLRDIRERRVARRARIAGCHEHLAHARTLRDPPCQRVFPATGADDEDVQGFAFGMNMRIANGGSDGFR